MAVDSDVSCAVATEIATLRDKLGTLEGHHEQMQRANGHIRRNSRAGLKSMGYSSEAIDTLFKQDSDGRNGYARYELDSSFASICRVRVRIAELERIVAREAVAANGDGYEYREEVGARRVSFVFPAKPAEEVRSLLKRHGFRWTPGRNDYGRSVYVAELSQAAISTARWLRRHLDDMCSPAALA